MHSKEGKGKAAQDAASGGLQSSDASLSGQLCQEPSVSYASSMFHALVFVHILYIYIYPSEIWAYASLSALLEMSLKSFKSKSSAVRLEICSIFSWYLILGRIYRLVPIAQFWIDACQNELLVGFGSQYLNVNSYFWTLFMLSNKAELLLNIALFAN